MTTQKALQEQELAAEARQRACEAEGGMFPVGSQNGRMIAKHVEHDPQKVRAFKEAAEVIEELARQQNE